MPGDDYDNPDYSYLAQNAKHRPVIELGNGMKINVESLQRNQGLVAEFPVNELKRIGHHGKKCADESASENGRGSQMKSQPNDEKTKENIESNLAKIKVELAAGGVHVIVHRIFKIFFDRGQWIIPMRDAVH